jgi:thiol-disulfide isomerase/thioredoxin
VVARLVSMRKMVAAAMLLALAVAAAGAAGWWFGRGTGPAAPANGEMAAFRETVPPVPVAGFTFTDGSGRPVAIGDLAGRIVLLNLWATWCAPCVREMPALDRLQARLGGPDFEVVALSLDRGGRDQVVPFLERLGVGNLALYLDPESAAMRELSPRGLPTTLLIDREGREVGRLEGAAEWDSPDALRLIRHYLGAGTHPSAPGSRT